MKNIKLQVLMIFLILSSCSRNHLRGSIKPSDDGKTYLIISGDNGGACGDLLVDNKKWPYKINEPGLIKQGTHTIECGGSIEFYIPDGVIFTFDYWGP